MAFVYRSDRTNNSEKNKISIGPGEYNEELSKTQGRLLHQNHMKYSSVMKNNKKPLIVPFNTTSKRSKLFDGDNLPGPGSYTLTSNFNNTNTRSSFTHTSSLMDKDIQEIFSMYKTNPNKKGFLSSEKRFNKSSTAEKFSPGPGSYELRSYFLKNENDSKNANNKYITEKYALNKGKTYKLPGNSEEITSSIPDKSKGEFKIVKGLLTQVKKPPYDSGQVGPGKYNLFSNWNAPGLTWNKGNKKEINNKNNDLKESISSAYASIVSLYMTTDLCDDPNAENICEKSINEALKYYPESIEALLQLSNLRIIRKRDNEAKEAMFKILEKIKKIDNGENVDQTLPERDVLINLSQNFAELKLFKEACYVINLLIKKDDEDIESYYLLAIYEDNYCNYFSSMEALDKFNKIYMKLQKDGELISPILQQYVDSAKVLYNKLSKMKKDQLIDQNPEEDDNNEDMEEEEDE